MLCPSKKRFLHKPLFEVISVVSYRPRHRKATYDRFARRGMGSYEKMKRGAPHRSRFPNARSTRREAGRAAASGEVPPQRARHTDDEARCLQSARRSRKRFCAGRKSSTPLPNMRGSSAQDDTQRWGGYRGARSVRGSPKMLAFLGVPDRDDRKGWSPAATLDRIGCEYKKGELDSPKMFVFLGAIGMTFFSYFAASNSASHSEKSTPLRSAAREGLRFQ